MIRMELK
jgi:hypothetical protein